MANPYIIEALIEGLRDKGAIPPSEENSTATLLSFINDEQLLFLTRLLAGAKQGYLEVTSDSSIDAGEVSVRLPVKAVAASLRLVEFIGANGGDAVPLNPVPEANVRMNAVVGAAGDYFLRGNSLYFARTIGAGTLRWHYLRRLNKVVLASSCAEITAVDTVADTVTVASYPVSSDWPTTAQTYDFIRGTPHFDVISEARSGTRASSVLTFSAGVSTSIVVGDFVALTGQTPIPNVPFEAHHVLVRKALHSWLTSIGDPKAGMAQQLYQGAMDDLQALFSIRTGRPSKHINYDGPGWDALNRRV